MNKTSILLGLTVLVIGGAAIIPQTALAYKGDPAVKGPNYTEERHTAMEKAFEKKDYNAWKTLMVGRGRVTQVVNAQNFAKFAQAHELAEQGKIAEANKIRAELGLGLQNGSGKGQGMGGGRMSR
ncbi:hypothetical protein M1437_01790 [Patescibacteria group bacterium]|nr:hypothetical protein [Patescibacteria group bacterium]